MRARLRKKWNDSAGERYPRDSASADHSIASGVEAFSTASQFSFKNFNSGA